MQSISYGRRKRKTDDLSISSLALALMLAGASGSAETFSVEADVVTAAAVAPAPLQVGAGDAASVIIQPAPQTPLDGAMSPASLRTPANENQTPESADAVPPAAVDVASAETSADVADAETADEENEIIVVARRRRTSIDPLEGLNVKSYEMVQSVDRAFVGPVAMTYKETIPRPIRSGLRNFMRNLTEPVVFLNYLLQFKVGKAAETAGRFAINSTLGVAGLFDTAKKEPFNLPYRNNGFGYTFGFYGVKPGPFLYLPFIGPTTLRDVSGRILDMMVMPFAFGKPFSQPAYAIPTTTLRLLDERAESDEVEDERIANSGDPYGSMREAYLTRRQAEIDALRGKKPAETSSNGAVMPEIEPVILPDLYEIVPVDVTEEALLPPPSIVLPDIMEPLPQ